MMTVGVGEWVEVWGVELYRPGIFIYIFINQKLLRGSEEATWRLSAVME